MCPEKKYTPNKRIYCSNKRFLSYVYTFFPDTLYIIKFVCKKPIQNEWSFSSFQSLKVDLFLPLQLFSCFSERVKQYKYIASNSLNSLFRKFHRLEKLAIFRTISFKGKKFISRNCILRGGQKSKEKKPYFY